MIVRALILSLLLSTACMSSSTPSPGTDRTVACGGPEETSRNYNPESNINSRFLSPLERDCHARDAVEPGAPLAWPPNSHTR